MSQNVGRFESLFSAPPEKPASAPLPGREAPPPPRIDMGPPVDGQKASYQELERKYRHRTYQAQELMVEKLLRGHFIDTKALERKLNMFDLHFDYKRFMVVLVRTMDNDAAFSTYASDIRDGGQVGLIVSSIFSELLGEQFACFPANLEDRYAFLLNFGRTDDGDISRQVAEICRDAVKFIRDNFCLELRVCVSGCCDDIYPLHEMFRETEMVSGDSNTVFNEGVCARAEGGAPTGGRRPEPTIEKQYLNALVTQDFQMALQLTLDKIHELYNENGDLDRVKMFLHMRMQTTSSVLAAPMGDPMEDGRPMGEDVMRLEHCSTMAELERALEQLFTQLDNHFNTAPSDYTGTTGKVIHLISKKYMEPDLSVEMICDYLGKSRSYLSRMFKENTGMNLLDYLHTTRLTEAKKLLNETDLGISEIASKVGYYSGWTLARVFKRYEGITPTAYRKAFCGMQDS